MPLFALFLAPPKTPPLLNSQITTSVRRAAAGVPFLASVKLTMPAGWHTYWKNPGDSGAPIDLKLTTPAGWKVEPLEWPVPVRIDAGGGVTYGYENSVELLFRVTPNEKSGWIKAFGDALICQSICQPAKIFAGTEVTVAPRDAESPQSGRLRELADTLPAPSEPGNLRVVRQGDNLVLSGFGDAKIFDFDAVIAPEAPIADGSVKLSPYATLGKSVKFLVVPKQGRARVVTVPVTTS